MQGKLCILQKQKVLLKKESSLHLIIVLKFLSMKRPFNIDFVSFLTAITKQDVKFNQYFSFKNIPL